MPRIPRSTLITHDGTYHVIARGNNRMRVFHKKDDYDAYLGMLMAAKIVYGVAIHHYVLMPNHVHLIVGESRYLPSFMQLVQLRYAKRYCRLKKHAGHVWQGRYKSFLIASDAYLFACGNYIELNPVRAKLAEEPAGWCHSSYKAYAFGEKDRLVTPDPFYRSLGATQAERQKEYRKAITKTRAS